MAPVQQVSLGWTTPAEKNSLTKSAIAHESVMSHRSAEGDM